MLNRHLFITSNHTQLDKISAQKSGSLVNGFTLPLISKSAHPFLSMSKWIGNVTFSVIPHMNTYTQFMIVNPMLVSNC